MKISFALEKIISRVYDLEMDRATDYIKKLKRADHAKIHSIDIGIDKAKIKLHSYHVPAYILGSKRHSTTNPELINLKIVNGYTGAIGGNTILSIIKSSLLGGGIGGILSFIPMVAGGPVGILSQLLLRVTMWSIISGTASGLFASGFNYWRNRNYNRQKDEDEKLNSQYIETDDDIERKKFAQEFINENFQKYHVSKSCNEK